MGTVYVSQALPRVDVGCFAGRPLEVTVSLVDGAGEALAAADVVSVLGQVRATIDDDTVLYTFGTAQDPVNAVVTDGAVTLTAASEVTAGWVDDDWPDCGPNQVAGWWDLEVVDTDGVTWPVLRAGRITVARQVTR